MFARRRCSFCRRWFYPHPRLKQRQKTCGQSDCRHKQKQKSSRQWRSKHPDYFRGSYEHQKKIYGTRSDYKRRYRQQHPDYVRRNAAFVQKCRQRLRSAPVSHTSPSMRRPVSVKTFLSSFLFFSLSASFISSFFQLFPLSQAASVATLPSALFVERLSPGARWVYLIQ